MAIIRKPNPKELIPEGVSSPGYTCTVCGKKYRIEIEKIWCERWDSQETPT